MLNLGELLKDRGKLEEAEPFSSDAAAGYRRVLGADHPETAVALTNLAALRNAQRRFAEAEPLLPESQRDLAAATEATASLRRETLRRLVALYAAWGRPADEARWAAELKP